MTGLVAFRRGGRARAAFAVLLSLSLGGVSQASSARARMVQEVEVRLGARDVTVAVTATFESPLELDSFALEGPSRLVIDLHDVRLNPEHPTCLPVDRGAIRQIRLGQFQLDPDIVRLVCDLRDEEETPAWAVAPGGKPGETLIIFPGDGPPALVPPVVERVEDAVVLRLPRMSELAYRCGTLEDPLRVYLDLTGAVVEEVYAADVSEGPIRQIRMAQQPSTSEHPVSRVVVELREPQSYSVFSDGTDLVVALGVRPWALPLPEYRPGGRLSGKRIVVDPGHGGHDIGAPAVYGPPHQPPFEKDIALDIGLRLARLLHAEGAEVTMTRDDDTYISLRGRASIANRLRADAFVSIHCNSCPVPGSLWGTSVYYDHEHSLALAELVQRELIAGLGTKDKGVRNANFAVIRRTRAPGILVETAFINHEGDRERLMHPSFRERAARAVLRGLVRFLTEDPGGGEPRR
jgi:N-acetylmuramoyl-L-alanine amidase